MAGTNVSQMLAFMQETIQTQQNAILKESVATKNTRKPNFDEFLQASTANVNNQKSVPKTENNIRQSREVVKQSVENKDVVEKSTTTPENKTENATKVLETVRQEEVDDVTKKNSTVVMSVFQNKVGQMVTENLQQNGMENVMGELGEQLIQLENMTDLPDTMEVPKNTESPEVIVTLGDGVEQTFVDVKTENEMLEQNNTEEEQPQILDLGNLEIRFEISEQEGISINVPEKLVTEETNISDKLVINVELSEDLKELLESIKNQLVQKIADNFDVTEEEVADAMETLAIQFFDLINSDKLKELAICLSNEENLVSMVTNEQLFTAYKEAETGIQEIMMDIPEELTEVLKDLGQKVEELQVELPKVEISEEVVMSKETEMIPEVEISQEDLKSEIVSQKTETINSDIVKTEHAKTEATRTEMVSSEVVNPETLKSETIVSEEKQEKVIPVEVEVVEAESTVEEQPKQEVSKDVGNTLAKGKEISIENTKMEQNNTSQNGSQKETENKGTVKSENSQAVQSNTTFSTIVTDTEVQTVVTTQRTDFDGIVRQIVEQVKVHVKPDTVSMDLQLNPESLGKVSLHVVSKDGAVTAQLMVQNETVKAAIEGQLTMLRETMQQQGIKVEAVEVAVQTGDFGRSLEHQSQQGKERENQQSKTIRNRGINLLSGVDEENMDEEELLRAHIMRESGNSVDMNA